MGWPIFWTCTDDYQGGDSQAGAARSVNRWREMLQVRLSALLAPAPRRLQQAATGTDSLPAMPCEGAREAVGTGPLPNMRDVVQAEPYQPINAVRESAVPPEERGEGGGKTVEGPTEDETLLVLSDRVHAGPRSADDMFAVMRQQARMESAMSTRAQRLRCVGNGVVPAQAALAFIVLARRAGLFTDHMTETP